MRDAGAYLCKYVTKGDSKNPLPVGARIYSAGGLPANMRTEYRWLRLPEYAREFFSADEAVQRVKGGFAGAGTGEFCRSPFDLAWHSQDWGTVCFVQARAYPVRGVA